MVHVNTQQSESAGSTPVALSGERPEYTHFINSGTYVLKWSSGFGI